MVEHDAYLHDTVPGVEKSNESAIDAVQEGNVVSSWPQVVDQGGGGVQGVETCSTILSNNFRDARLAGENTTTSRPVDRAKAATKIAIEKVCEPEVAHFSGRGRLRAMLADLGVALVVAVAFVFHRILTGLPFVG